MTVSLAACSNSAQGTQGSEPAAAGTEAAGTEAASDSAAAAESTEAQEPAAEGKVTGIDDLPGRQSVFSLEPPGIFMHPIMKNKVLLSSVSIKGMMRYRHFFRERLTV